MVETTEQRAAAAERLKAPGVNFQQSERERAILIARVLLKAPNIDRTSDIGILARQFLREVGAVE